MYIYSLSFQSLTFREKVTPSLLLGTTHSKQDHLYTVDNANPNNSGTVWAGFVFTIRTKENKIC